MPGRKSRDKGKRGQLEFVKVVEAHGLKAIDMGNLQSSSNVDVPDVSIENVALVEVKRRESFSLYPALEQAVRAFEAYALKRDCAFPVVAHRRNRKEWVIVLRAEDFFELLKAYESTRC